MDFYDPEMREIEIPLSPQLSPQQNAARFYKDYARAKHAEQMLTGLIAKGEQELDYFNSILDELSRAEGEKDVGRHPRRADGRRLSARDRPEKADEAAAVQASGVSVQRGVFHICGPEQPAERSIDPEGGGKRDLWLHVQKIHGSHVVIVCAGQAPGDQTVTEAAMLAAWHSQAREGQNVRWT